MDMPGTVKRFFHADSRNDADALSQAFAPDAVVEDEGARHHGVAAIRGWWVAAKTAAQYVVEPLESVVEADTASVRAKVSGQFPGSPVMLTYAFTVTDDRIARLEIR